MKNIVLTDAECDRATRLLKTHLGMDDWEGCITLKDEEALHVVLDALDEYEKKVLRTTIDGLEVDLEVSEKQLKDATEAIQVFYDNRRDQPF